MSNCDEHQTTISRTLRKRIPVVIRKRRKAPKMDNEDQEKKLWQTLSNDFE